MRSILKKIINQLKEQQKKLFLIDSIGAFITAFLLFAVLRNFNQYIGLSKEVLTYLALTAFAFSLYSACFLFLKQYCRVFIWVIIIANLFYCILIILVLTVNYPLITVTGFCYFLIEIIIICILVYIELNVASAVSKQCA